MHSRRVGLEVTELLLLLGIQPPLSTSLFWRFVERAVLVGHSPVHSQTGWHTEQIVSGRQPDSWLAWHKGKKQLV